MKGVLKFLVPSLIGVFLFITPIMSDGVMTIAIAVMLKWVVELIAPIVNYLLLLFIFLSAGLSLVARFFKPRWIVESQSMNMLFNPPLVWLSVRLLACVIVVMTLFEVGFEMVWSGSNGGFVVESLLPTLVATFMLAGMFLPLLLNFGLLEFVGTLLTRVMRPVFGLPGRSSIDCVASWFGDGTIGILLTSKQYEQGYYTAREAAVIGTNFSAVSITFSLVVIETVGLGHMFFPFYMTVMIAGFVTAVVVPRIPPLSRKSDSYYQGRNAVGDESIPEGEKLFDCAMRRAVQRAESGNTLKGYFREGARNVVEMWLGVIPAVMAIGTLALILSNNTSIFEWLGVPFVPLLDLLGIPEAEAASKSVLVGFSDMFVPALIAAEGVAEPMTRFIVAALSVTQLIFMAEVGVVLLSSKIPLSLLDLVIVFLQRTIVSLPIIALAAHLIF